MLHDTEAVTFSKRFDLLKLLDARSVPFYELLTFQVFAVGRMRQGIAINRKRLAMMKMQRESHPLLGACQGKNAVTGSFGKLAARKLDTVY